HWHTIEFSDIIATQRTGTICMVTAHYEQKICFCQGLFSYRRFSQSLCDCGALSVALTHIKLHTTLKLHKSAGDCSFLALYT
ncbi:hypothetical protein, partial [Corynebacterium sp. HMSC076D02]|uniref:hypothetical protein n=1 Tax=Corynebacterium sp. HMSC076D02 TaxID=1739439 RepID=UPI001AEFFD7A